MERSAKDLAFDIFDRSNLKAQTNYDCFSAGWVAREKEGFAEKGQQSQQEERRVPRYPFPGATSHTIADVDRIMKKLSEIGKAIDRGFDYDVPQHDRTHRVLDHISAKLDQPVKINCDANITRPSVEPVEEPTAETMKALGDAMVYGNGALLGGKHVPLERLYDDSDQVADLKHQLDIQQKLAAFWRHAASANGERLQAMSERLMMMGDLIDGLTGVETRD